MPTVHPPLPIAASQSTRRPTCPQALTGWDEHIATAKDVIVEASCVVPPEAAGDNGATGHRLGGGGGCAQAAIASSPAVAAQEQQQSGHECTQ
jgi:hypothetical protein